LKESKTKRIVSDRMDGNRGKSIPRGGGTRTRVTVTLGEKKTKKRKGDKLMALPRVRS